MESFPGAPRSFASLPSAAVGLGFRPEIAADLLASPECVDFVEVVAEACFASPAAHREALAVSRVWPVVPHGVKLSLGSAEGIDRDRARRLGALARELRAKVVTEHVAFVRAGGREIGHLTQVPFTRESARVVAKNVAALRRELPDVPLLLENTAWTFRWPGDELDEPTFFTEIVERTGCDLLLDLGNLYANARNAGEDPLRVLAAYPLDRVGMVHIAGGVLDEGFYFDTHAHPVPEAVLELLGELAARVGPVPVVLERDDGFPPFDELVAEVARARHAIATPPRERRDSAARAPLDGGLPSRAQDLARDQLALALALTDHEPLAETVAVFGEDAIERSRDVLRKKRVDDALPHLTRLLPHREALRELGLACVARVPRAPSLASVTDALAIARAASADAHLEAAARVDLLLLRGRFVEDGEGGTLRPRAAPFVGRERLSGGRVVWVVKGPGADAALRLYETRR
jgi:uncharacterized protein (UPF0276 family)